MHITGKVDQQGAFSPIFTLLGYYRSRGGLPRFYASVREEVRCYRPWELASMAFMLDLYPDHEHWRSLFPKRDSQRVNLHAAREWFTRAFMEAGPYDPPEDLKPADAGRPKGARDTYQRTRSKNGSKTTV